MRKDILAAGGRKMTIAGGIGDSPLLQKIAEDEANGVIPVEEPEITFTPSPRPTVRKKFVPLGTILLVRQAQSEAIGFTSMEEALAAPKTGDIAIVNENAKEDKPCEGTVLEAGPKASVAKGSTIVFDKYAGQEYVLNGETLLLMEEDRVKGTLETIQGDDYIVLTANA